VSEEGRPYAILVTSKTGSTQLLAAATAEEQSRWADALAGKPESKSLLLKG